MDATTATTKRMITQAIEQYASRGKPSGFVFFGYSRGDNAYYCIWADSNRANPQPKLVGTDPNLVLEYALAMVETDHTNFVHMPDR